MSEEKLLTLLKNYKSNQSKVALIAGIVFIIFTSLIFFTDTKYLLYLNLIIIPLVIRFVIVYDFKKWKNNTAKICNIDSAEIDIIAEQKEIEARKVFQSGKEIIFFTFLSSVSICICSYFAWEKIEFNRYGKESVAQVYQINSGIKRSYALLYYEVDGKRYTTSIQLQIGYKFSDRMYYGKKHIVAKIGQKFRIKFSQKKPEIHQIISEYPNE